MVAKVEKIFYQTTLCCMQEIQNHCFFTGNTAIWQTITGICHKCLAQNKDTATTKNQKGLFCCAEIAKSHLNTPLSISQSLNNAKARKQNRLYICNVFFMVLDLRLMKVACREVSNFFIL